MEIKVNNTFFTGKFLLHLPSVDSTNNFAKDYIAKSSPIDGTVILADEQFAGRGQSGNSWFADRNKNLTFSIIYQTSFLLATEQFYLNMAVSLGLCDTLRDLLNLEGKLTSVTIKWPNDMYAAKKKIAGILIENTIQGHYLKYSIIGIGVNVNQDGFPDEIQGTSLKILSHEEFALNGVLNQLLVNIEKYFFWLKERKFDHLKTRYIDNLYLYKVLSSFKNKEETIFEGKIIDIDVSGNLIVENSLGTQKFGFKEIAYF